MRSGIGWPKGQGPRAVRAVPAEAVVWAHGAADRVSRAHVEGLAVHVRGRGEEPQHVEGQEVVWRVLRRVVGKGQRLYALGGRVGSCGDVFQCAFGLEPRGVQTSELGIRGLSGASTRALWSTRHGHLERNRSEHLAEVLLAVMLLESFRLLLARALESKSA